ncbi:MAG: phosphotransferase [Hellea sp.]|nr:phosphotransferase [Hellea sp.]
MGASSNSLDKRTENWVKANFPSAAPKLLVKHPWASTWRFMEQGQVYYLKQIKSDGARKVQSAVNISTLFDRSVPKVAASNSKLAVMAVEDHGGTELKSRTKNMSTVLPSYARLQARAIEEGFDAGCLPKLEISALYQEFLDFLIVEPKDKNSNLASAKYFLGPKRADRLYHLFADLEPVVQPFLARASSLPYTINHCDLRPPNMAARDDETISIFDWDDAVWGPAGLSLHSQFSGCLRPFDALTTNPARKTSSTSARDRKHLDAYIRVFAEQGFIEAGKMREALPAAIFAGVIKYIIEFRHYRKCGDKLKKTIRRNILKRADSLLDVLDRLVHGNHRKSQILALAYFKASEEERLAGFEQRCEQKFVKIPKLNKDALEHSRKVGGFPEVKFSDLERDLGVCTRENAKLAAKIYKEQGVVLLSNALDRSMLADCHEHLLETYDEYFQDKRPKDSLRVGNKRFMITLSVEGPINQPNFYAPPTIMPVLERLLSDKLILGSLVAVTSLPGAKNQSRHRDHHALFPEVGVKSPPFATSVMLPLIHMDEEVGATRLFKGTHLQPTDIANKMPEQDPVVPVGSCFLMDYRVQHMGMANKSKDKIRPVLTLIFQRPWFRDYVNYDNQERLIIPDGEYDKIPEIHRPLFDWK